MSAKIRVVAKNSEEQEAIDQILARLRKDFPSAEIAAVPQSKKLLPEEVALLIAIQISGDIILQVLNALWNYLKSEDIEISLDPVDRVQAKAEEFLRHKGLRHFSIVKTENKGLYVNLVFRSNKHTHRFSIASSDLSILTYEERDL